jgi:crotonobetainyl-CoA:carnitine CoA-transferase CaiB-like acyl-CoA transferase
VQFISARLATKTSAEWVAILSREGIPVAVINTVAEVMADPQIRAREMILEADHRTAGHVRMLACPVKMSRTPPRFRLPPPTLGEHTAELMSG